MEKGGNEFDSMIFVGTEIPDNLVIRTKHPNLTNRILVKDPLNIALVEERVTSHDATKTEENKPRDGGYRPGTHRNNFPHFPFVQEIFEICSYKCRLRSLSFVLR
jgi:hypothetical protein